MPIVFVQRREPCQLCLFGVADTSAYLLLCQGGGGRKFIVGGNWKCNGNKKMIADLCTELGKGESIAGKNVEVVMGCPYLYADYTRSHLRPDWGVCLQNCWTGKGGAFTGEISAEMIKDIGVEWVILGHSERRSLPQLKEVCLRVKGQQSCSRPSMLALVLFNFSDQNRTAGHRTPMLCGWTACTFYLLFARRGAKI